MKKPVLRFRTLILSDVHLGAPDCQIDKVNHLLKQSRCEKLILNGDIIDGWSLGRQGGWNRKHTRFIRYVLKFIDKRKTDVIYLRGNHDDILDRFLPLTFGRLKVVDKYIHETVAGKRYMVVHGDLFDAVTQNSKLIAILGDIGYQSLLKINRIYNQYRSWRGKDYFSLSKAIKAKTKTVVNYISRFENQIEGFVEKFGCEGFICGHIHTPDDKMLGDIHYLNSGDWVESNTALVEHLDGRWEILSYDDFCDRLKEVERFRDTPVPFPQSESTLFEEPEPDEEEAEEIRPNGIVTA